MSRTDPIEALRRANPVPAAGAVLDAADRERLRQRVVADTSPVSPRRAARVPSIFGRPQLALLGIAAAVVVVVLSAGGGSGLPGPVAALADAASRGAAVLHTVDDGPHVDDASGGPSARRVETWQRLDRRARRVRTTYADGSFQDMLVKRVAGRYRVTIYRSRKHELYVAPWLRERRAARARAAESLITQPISAYTQAVRTGSAAVEGTELVRGRHAVRVVDRSDGPLRGTVFLVATDSPRPALLEVRPRCRSSHRLCKPTAYATYEVLFRPAALRLPRYHGEKVVRAG